MSQAQTHGTTKGPRGQRERVSSRSHSTYEETYDPSTGLTIRTAIAPNPVVPTSIPSGPSSPAADPPWWEARAIYDHGNMSETLPPEPDRDALAVLVEARGVDRCIADVAGGLAWCDRLIRDTLAAVQSPLTQPAAVQRLIRLTAARATYSERLKALGGDAGPGLSLPMDLIRYAGQADPVPAIDKAIAAAAGQLGEIDQAVDAIRQTAADDDAYARASIPPGNRGNEEFAGIAEAMRRTYPHDRSYIESIVSQLGAVRSHRPYPARGPMDNLLAQLGDLLRRRTEAARQLRQLEADRDEVTALVADRAEAAITAAGGPSAITAAVHSALTLADPGAVPSAELAGVDADLRRLAEGGVTDGDAVDVLTARRAELTAAAAAARVASGQGRKARAVELVRGAEAGGEQARADIERLARAVPRAFPGGFAESIASARFDQAVMAELAALVG